MGGILGEWPLRPDILHAVFSCLWANPDLGQVAMSSGCPTITSLCRGATTGEIQTPGPWQPGYAVIRGDVFTVSGSDQSTSQQVERTKHRQ